MSYVAVKGIKRSRSVWVKTRLTVEEGEGEGEEGYIYMQGSGSDLKFLYNRKKAR